MAQTIILRTTKVSTASGLKKLRRDPLLDDDNGGVKFMFDTAFPYCMPAAAPVDAQVIKDAAEVGNGSFQLGAGQTLSYSGGGIDFTGLTLDPACIRGPVGSLASIWAAANQYFMVVGWDKFPASGDFNTDGVITPHFCASGSAGYQNGAELVCIAQQNTPRFDARRQTDGGATVAVMGITALTSIYGTLIQWSFWRNASGCGFRIRNAAGTQITTAAVGSNNTGNFSALQPQWGVPEALNDLSTKAAHRLAAKRRLYRGWVEDLSLSGRDPLTVLDADYAFVTGRSVFS